MQRPLDGVLPGLVPGDPLRRLTVPLALGRPDDVEELTDVQLDAQLVPHGLGRRRGVAQELVGVDEGEVAHQDGHALAEPARLAEPAARLVAVGEGQMGRADTPSGRGAVHHVVVEEGERVEQLEGRTGVSRPRVIRVAAGADEAPVGEGRAQALAAGQHQRLQRGVGRVELGVEGRPPGPLAVEERPEPHLHAVGDLQQRRGDDGHDASRLPVAPWARPTGRLPGRASRSRLAGRVSQAGPLRWGRSVPTR